MNESTMLSCVPVLQVKDARKSCNFYCNVLGFVKNWEHQFESGFPLFVSISHDSVTLFLTEHLESSVGALVYIYVKDVNALAEKFQTNGVILNFGPADQPWGVREIHLCDPDGNKLRFGQSLD